MACGKYAASSLIGRGYATLSLMVGIVALALGICFFVKPELFVSILPFILGLYLIFDGVVKLQAAIDIKKGATKNGASCCFWLS